ncbi:hypothetical protein I6E81_07325 [Salinibacterium sp. NG22]|uniref:hypothetical protein n=1 Tax=Salinibacterium sp. NG22 TaxID=2792040 RepID=UPI0018CCF1E4|nr:hypothetical protein [Salinibacterium sp. NG22]MBH0109974.1 hypothetical protein [Salinibacterium sp. NG22]
MRNRIWAVTSGLLGAAILVLLFFYGIEYGTWIDEAGPLTTSPPTFLLPFAIGGIAGILMIGGFAVSLSGLNTESSFDA